MFQVIVNIMQHFVCVHDVPVLLKLELKPQGRLLMEARYFLEKKGESVLHTTSHTHA